MDLYHQIFAPIFRIPSSKCNSHNWLWFFEGRAKQLGPILKIVLCIGISLILVVWPPIGVLSSILAGLGYGFLAPIIATFEAVGEGKTNMFFHCFWVQ